MVRFVVMAAGLATRMGKDKLVLPWKDTTVLGYVLQTVLEALILQEQRFVESSHSGVTEVYVVARHPMEIYLTTDCIRRFHACGGVWIQVPSPKPLAETIRSGLQDINSKVHWIGFLPGDQVGITAPRLADCLQQILLVSPDFLVPFSGDKAGSPVFFHKRYVPELLALQGEKGGREVLYRYPELWEKYPVEESLFLDVDTPEQYNALRGQISK
ncbi:nucleotidyltransferase family protein [Desulfosporosinus fructosivorans]|uniref:Nucleotidyltransferase family protein n=1 Tax=Desulfosporosinus fructosivorans TaxID=2018669 RepID=A0A4Z0R1E5_9FIRM|nr:NTP transferase domain-containing protein [Desulfosporosinus fructosivorans]TGE36195.1 nucleotidyltransferase family protein [Desulfosporosinus fructosivorans]